MTVNIFGSSGSRQSEVFADMNYVDSKFITLVRNLENKLEKTGGILTGNLNAGNHKITSTFIPNTDDVVTNKSYVDESITHAVDNVINGKVNKSGDTMTGDLIMVNSKITNLSDPILNGDACNKHYVDELFKQYVDNTVQHVSSVIDKAIGNLDFVSRSSVDDLINSKIGELKHNRRQQRIQGDNLLTSRMRRRSESEL